jgi:zinc protease
MLCYRTRMKQTAHIFLATILTTVLLLVKSAFAISIPVTEYALDNGLRVVVIEDHRAPVVFHAVTYGVGGADEAPGKTGLAHFFEHLMFKGTTKYPTNSFDNLLDENGVERNAFTNLDNTVFYERTSPALLELMMDLEADRMQNLVLTPGVLEQERKVVQEERRLRTDSDAYGTAVEKMNAVLFKVHPYGRPVVGLAEDVAKLTLDDAMNFYRAHYATANAVVLVVGDVVPTDVLKLAQKYYGPLANTAPPAKLKRPAEPRHVQAEILELEDARISDPFFYRVYNAGTNSDVTQKRAAALSVLASILGSNWQSRLIDQLVTREKIASSVTASYGSSLSGYGQFQFSASPRGNADILDLEKRVDAILQQVINEGVTANELQDAKNTAEAANIYMRDNPIGFGLGVATVLSAGQKADYFETANREMMALTPQDVQDAARSVLDVKQSVTLILRPKR